MTLQQTQTQTFCALCLQEKTELDIDCHCPDCVKYLAELEEMLANRPCPDCKQREADCICLYTDCGYCGSTFKQIDGYGAFCSRYCSHAVSGAPCYCCYDDN